MDLFAVIAERPDFHSALSSTRSLPSWESKYGSLILSGYDIGTSDGMNESGLVVNMLALVESDYGKPSEGTKVISLSTWAQYILDNHATVSEAVADLKKEYFRVQTVVLPTGRPANMHLAISDPTGDSAVFEYVNGKLVIHHGKQYKVMTNSPTYDKSGYWLCHGFRLTCRWSRWIGLVTVLAYATLAPRPPAAQR
jgi:penicillin V acylase-like amidase (Ntn superfamily)